MNIEDDVLGAFKYAGFGQRVDPAKMIHSLLVKLEVSMLSQMGEQIRARLSVLKGEESPTDDQMDPFTILGVSMDSTREEVDRAYREKAKAVHPDKHSGSTESNIEMVRLNAAYEAVRLFKGWKPK